MVINHVKIAMWFNFKNVYLFGIEVKGDRSKKYGTMCTIYVQLFKKNTFNDLELHL